VEVAVHAAELLDASSIPAAHRGIAICPSRQRLTLRERSRLIEIIDSNVGLRSVLAECGRQAAAEHDQGLVHPSSAPVTGTSPTSTTDME